MARAWSPIYPHGLSKGRSNRCLEGLILFQFNASALSGSLAAILAEAGVVRSLIAICSQCRDSVGSRCDRRRWLDKMGVLLQAPMQASGKITFSLMRRSFIVPRMVLEICSVPTLISLFVMKRVFVFQAKNAFEY